MKTYSFQAMGSRILVAMDTESEDFADWCGKTVKWFEEWEQIFSRFRLTSELSELNSKSGEWVWVSSVFWKVFRLSLKVKEMTHGLVTPEALNALENAGYAISFDDMAEHMDELLRRPMAQIEEIGDIELAPSRHSIRLPKGQRIDLGGVVKGWAAMQAMSHLQKVAPVLVDAGGDISVSGPLENGEAWPVGVADPNDATHNLRLVMINRGGLATSGRDYRRWQKDGRWQHHIIDPRIDRPAETDILSATVFAPDLVTAEAYAKMGLILGSTEGAAALDQVKNLGYFFALEDGTQLSNKIFDEMVWNEQWINQRKKISA